MSDDAELEARVARTKALAVQIQQVLAEADATDALDALAAILAQRCVEVENPDRMFLQSIDSAIAAFREISNTKYRNENKAVS